MHRLTLGLTLVITMFSSVAIHAQSPQKPYSSTEITTHSESLSALMDRSETQVPKPIPVVRPLRFQEIPASPGVNGNVERKSAPVGESSAAGNEQQNECLSVVVPQTKVIP